MSNIVSGNVVEVITRGNATNIKLDDGKLYGCGFDGVPCKQGDFVSFATYQNGKYTNADVKTMEVSEGKPQQQKQAPAPQQSGGGMSKDDYWRRKEESDASRQRVIEWQSARNAAIHVAEVAVAADALPLPAKKADKFDGLVDIIESITRRYYDEATTVKEGGEVGQAAVQTEQAGGSDGGFE